MILLCAVCLAACVSETDAPRGGQGTFSMGLTTSGLTAEIVTRAQRPLTTAEAETFMLTLSDTEITMWEHKAFSEITLADRTQPIGDGYVLTAEDITPADAESVNDGWGARRYAGSSAPFAILNGETTYVTVPCAMANAGLCVTFDASFTSYFTEYAVTTDDVRSLKFNADNALPATFVHTTGSVKNALPAGTAVAWYNTDEATATVEVPVIISASAGWDGTVRLTRTLLLQKGKITCLKVTLNSSEPSAGNISVFAITHDDGFAQGTDEEIFLE